MPKPCFREFRMLLAPSIVLLTVSVIAQNAAPRLPADRLDGPPLAEVLILGSYHMDNPGRDIINMQADDVLTAKRQSEIRDVLDTVARFHPTKIAIEAPSDSPKLQMYQEYLAGKHELSRDEREQIGFSLGKKLKLPKIYGIDVPGEFPFATVQDYAKAHGREQQAESLGSNVQRMVQEDDAFLKSHTILQMLQRINSSEAVRRDLAAYAMFAHFGEEDDWAGATLLTDWYQRNMRIHTNLLNILQPGDRVLVVYGSGHLGLLRRSVEADPTLKLRTLDEFVKP